MKNECDPAWALLGEQLEAEARQMMFRPHAAQFSRGLRLKDAQLRLAAVVGLGYAYAGSCREDTLTSP